MVWWNPTTWGGSEEPVGAPAAVVASPGEGSGPSPDLSDFMRATWDAGRLTASDLVALGAIGMGCTEHTQPQQVPDEILDAIHFDPIFYYFSSVATAPARDPELYYVRCETDPKARAEVESWLRPLLTRQRAPLLAQIARAFTMGTVPIVLDYAAEDLSWKQEKPAPAEGQASTFTRTVKGHVHYVRSHEVWPGNGQLRVDGDRLLGVVDASTGVEYGGEDLEDAGRARAFLSIWDPSYGRWRGNGAAMRAYADWLEGKKARLWELRALERVVDPARVGYAPEGDLTIGGTKVSAVKLLRSQMMSLRNGSVITLPGTLDASGHPLWRLEAPFQPGLGHEISKQAIDARDLRKAWACLSPGGSDKATEEQFMDSVQSVCDFVASFLTRVVNVGLRVSRGDSAPFVQVLANDIPKRKLRIVQQVFSTVAQATQRTADGKVYTLAELVHPEILDQLGIKARTVEEAAREAPEAPEPAPTMPVGRPLEPAGAREERRDNAETIDGEEDTGGEDMEREPQAGSDA